MHEHLRSAAVRREVDHRGELALVAVHAARRQQAEHVNGSAAAARGFHRIEVRAEGHETHVEQVNLIASSTPREFNVHLAPEGEMTEEERQATREEQEAARAGATTSSCSASNTERSL